MSMAPVALLPILVPLVAIVANLLIGGTRGARVVGLNIAFSIVLMLVAVLLSTSLLAAGEDHVVIYPLGNWPIPFGIVLVADRLAAIMVLTTSLLALAAMIYACARWYRNGTSFFPLFHALTMGLNGAFLTGDLFNLFVFFELLLAASYGLVLHGSGRSRVRAALHYIAVNLLASFLFLLGVALIYGTVGTLNMADIARLAPDLVGSDRALFETGAAILGVAFLIKAGAWPLNFWLSPAYTAAAPPVAALFAIMTKVGFYALLRLWTLVFAGQAEGAAFGQDVLFVIGLLTIAYGSINALAAKALDRLATSMILVSAGTLLLAVSYHAPAVTAGALFYLVTATFAAGALFLLKDIIDQTLPAEAQMLAVSLEYYGEDDEQIDEDEEVSRTIPAGAALISWCFAIVALVLAGLPPLSGFLAKFVMISSAFATPGRSEAFTWWFIAALILSGLMTLIAMVRTGINVFWTSLPATGIRVRVLEITPVVGLLFLCVAMAVLAGPVIDTLGQSVAFMHSADAYEASVLGLGAQPQ